jgi:hypothetical protein
MSPPAAYGMLVWSRRFVGCTVAPGPSVSQSQLRWDRVNRIPATPSISFVISHMKILPFAGRDMTGVTALLREIPHAGLGPGTAILVGYLLGRLTDAVFLHRSGPSDIVREVLSPATHSWNVIFWAALIILLGAVLRNARRKPTAGTDSLIKFQGPRVGTVVTLQMCPTIREGWPLGAVQIHHTAEPFLVPDEHASAYREYVARHFASKRFFDDRVKVALTRNPVAFSDSPTLVLQTCETHYSVVQYYHEHVATVPVQRAALLGSLVRGPVRFPNSLCLQALVLTRDDRVLPTARSPKVSYYPGAWSCSIEEQLAVEDLRAGPRRAVELWCHRMLREELGLADDAFQPDAARVLSVFLEADALNISLSALVRLEITASELDRILRQGVRPDYEFTDWAFMPPDDLSREVARPTRFYHLTSGYRMALELLRRDGATAPLTAPTGGR